jgi:hypothetical protein
MDAKRAYFDRLDAKLAAEGYAVSPPAPVPMGDAPMPAAPPQPAPPPPLTFEAWAELSVRYDGAPPESLAGALFTRGVTYETWKRLDGEYLRALRDDLKAGQWERPVLYEAMYKAEQARRAGDAAAPSPAPAAEPLAAEAPPALPALAAAHAAFGGTAESPEMAAALFEVVSRMPFVPPPPAPAAPAKRSPKTEQSLVMPSRVGGQTMSLDAGTEQRPTPTLPFSGSAGVAGVVHVPPLGARQFVALCAELWLQAAPRKETLSRYHVPNEAAFRALEEQWLHPSRRAELETALAELAVALRSQVLRGP